MGARVASPICLRQKLSMAMKKRDLPSHHHHRQQRTSDWSSKNWYWDSVGFVARPVEQERRCGEGEHDERLRLQLGGGGGLNSGEQEVRDEPASRPSKRLRSGSPSAPVYPMCQVDDCKEDLSAAKDYHRRHKVCQVHSKSTNAMVANQFQRFCQQCSRFHPVSEFDEGKRSCRRRLAGHNRRRRKTQTEDDTSPQALRANRINTASGSLDMVNLLAVLASVRGNSGDERADCSMGAVSEREELIQILGKIKSLNLPMDYAKFPASEREKLTQIFGKIKSLNLPMDIVKFPTPGSLGCNIPEDAASDQQSRLDGNACSSSSMELLPVPSATPAFVPDAHGTVCKNSQSTGSEDTNLACVDHVIDLNLQEVSTVEFHSVQRDGSNSSCQPSVNGLDSQVKEPQANLPLQLFSSLHENGGLSNLASTRKYFTSESSSPMEDRSPFSSPSPVAQKLFPMQTLMETMKHETKNSKVAKANIEASIHDCDISLQLFQEPNRGVDSASFQNIPHQAWHTSSSGSDNSHSSLNSDAQNSTGRIVLKLFDKDPSQLPGTLRTQIFKWLSHIPSEMESYIRPGCVIFSIYVSVPPAVWEQFEKNLLQHVNSLVQDSDSDFWRNGRFVVHAGKQLASHKDGNIRLCKSFKIWKTPELVSVFPLAVVGGQETSLTLRGKNLTTPGTMIHCTYMGGYVSKEISSLAYGGSMLDEIKFGSFKVQDAAPFGVGRCFIEVENGIKGNSFPLIIADATICAELRLLESEFDEKVKVCDTNVEEESVEFGNCRSREDVLHFLNELGWFFQRKRITWRLHGPDYVLAQFKFLVTFSVDRDCCVLVKTLLDLLLNRSLGGDRLPRDSLEALSDIHLLNRAVKRRCRDMVDMLIHYSVSIDTSKMYIFPPNHAGADGCTSLHLAACMPGLDGMVDVLTSDPQEIGLYCWDSLLDVYGVSPCAYASKRNNHSYNVLVTRKLADRRNGQTSVTLGNDLVMGGQERIPQAAISCARCALRPTNQRRNLGSRGLLQRPYIHFTLAVAAVCACVCLFFRALQFGYRLENIEHGTL